MAIQQFKIGAFDVEFEVNSGTNPDGVTLRCSTGGGPGGRFLEIKNGGGHLELEAPGGITSAAGLELDENGRAVFHPLNEPA